MAVLPLWSCLLVSYFSVSLAELSNLSDLYPPLWEESPGQFSDYQVENGTYIIDPWVYTDRLGMYKILINKTATYFEKYAPENEQNILWGLPVQHGWQYRTGRLADPRRWTDCGYESGDRLCISVDSWWADVNFFLCALPFLAAVDSDIMGISSDQVMLLPPSKDQTKFCLNVSSCQSSFPGKMRQWIAFFQHLQSPSTSFDELLEYLWGAHTSTLDYTDKSLNERLEYLSKPEANFGRNWATAVKYLGASLFPTTLIRVHEFQKGLPSRMFVNGDRGPFISDFTNFQNTVLLSLNLLYKVDNSIVSSTLKPFQPLELSTPHQQEDTAAFGECLDISSSLSHTLQVHYLCLYGKL